MTHRTLHSKSGLGGDDDYHEDGGWYEEDETPEWQRGVPDECLRMMYHFQEKIEKLEADIKYLYDNVCMKPRGGPMIRTTSDIRMKPSYSPYRGDDDPI